MRTKDLVNEITVEDRLRGAVWGQFVGDAAALGTHWIYNLSDLQKVYPSGVNGFEEPLEGHYHFGKKPGDQTHYGDGALVLLESLAKEGRFDPEAFGRSFVENFRPDVYTGYIDKATRGTLENYQAFVESHAIESFDFQQGADDDQLAAASRLAALVVRYREDPDLLTLVEQATRVCQNNPRAVAYMKFHALLLSELLSGRDIHTALHRTEEQIVSAEPELGLEVRRKTRQAMEETLYDVTKATLTFGQSCPLISSFPASIHALLKHPDDFKSGILATLRAGGDNAGRASMLGSWLGAHLGINNIPKNWRTRLNYGDRISTAIGKIL
ncbi:MAG: ADP-ribosylglycohydrolase family protein [Verrucomicrobia bacterium]|nr:ADP-ribosylglycohydrolase family protein [Verrucomicrobiota bacterium]MBV8641617.1 ADP-ribosylglycohydrolase family protein [Verrucomicrobiota bacterium]